jgi:hypothetical protein
LIWVNGRRHINPLFDSAKIFRIAADPFPVNVGPGQSVDLSIIAQAEENHFGDFLCSQILQRNNPDAGRFEVFLTNKQDDRTYMNAPVLDRFVFSNAQLSNNIPCCFLIQATNFLQIRATSLNAVDTQLKLVTRGRRFLPYQYPHLRDQLLAYWDENMSTPFWLTVDRLQQGSTANVIALPGGGVRIPGGDQAVVLMTVPGGGDFEAKDLLCDVRNAGTGAQEDGRDLLVDIKEGVGRSIMDQPMDLVDFLARPNREDVGGGFQAAEFRAGSGAQARQFSQFFKRNTRVRIELDNQGGPDLDVRLCFVGCMHYYPECPPGRDLERQLSVEPTVGPRFIQAPRCPPVHGFAPIPGQGMQPVQGVGPVPQVPPEGWYPPRGMQGFQYADDGIPGGGY